jgi:pyrimidine operon attenuation protein/uracil phosphoribosyltransferase
MNDMLRLDAEALYTELLGGVRALLGPEGVLVGIWSGGAWLAERLQADLGRSGAAGVISSTLHRDDFGSRGMATGTDATKLPFAIDGSHILLIDDVLYTCRTIRAVINELYDFGRPASVSLAVLVDRGGRELPIQADYVGLTTAASPSDRIDVRVRPVDPVDEVGRVLNQGRS